MCDPIGGADSKYCTITSAMVSATIEDGVQVPAIVWVHYKNMENEYMSGWAASNICPRDQWAPHDQVIVYRVVTEHGWFARNLIAVGSFSEQSHSSRLAPNKYWTEYGTDKEHQLAMFMTKPIFTLTDLQIQLFTVLGIGGAKGHMTEVVFGVASAMMVEGQSCRDCITAQYKKQHNCGPTL